MIDTSVAHSARIYDFILGGKDNFEADRQAAAAIIERSPGTVTGMRANRALMRRMTKYLAGELGVRQFLDIGAGLPTSPNVHEIAQGIDPGSRVVYVDNDPIVLAHARALLVSTREGACDYIHADLRDPAALLASPRLTATLDRSEPVALTLFGVMQFVPDEADPYGIVATLMDALPSGSYLAIQHPTADFYPPGGGASEAYRSAGIRFRYRTKAEFERFCDKLETADPGIVPMTDWHPEIEPGPRLPAAQAAGYAVLAKKP